MLRRLAIISMSVLLWHANAPRSALVNAADSDPSLRLVSFGVLEKPTSGSHAGRFVLSDGEGKTLYQVRATEGVDLGSFLGHRVQVTGRVESVPGSSVRRVVAEKISASNRKGSAHFLPVSAETPAEPAETKTQTVPVPRPQGAAAAGERKPEATAPSPQPGPRSLPELLPPAQAYELTDNGPVMLDTGEPLPPGATLAGDGLPAMNDAACGPPGRLYVRAEALWWWTKGMDLPPLVTTSTPGTPPDQAGVLGAPGTSTLLGGDSLVSDVRQGIRLQGGLFGPRRRVGIEVEYATLEDEELWFGARSNGRLIIARPFTNIDPNLGAAQGPDSALVSYPNEQAGAIDVHVTSQFDTGAIHLRSNLTCRNNSYPDPYNQGMGLAGYRLDLLSGYRRVRLEESLGIYETLSMSVIPQAGLEVTDLFAVKNDFQGGELGLHGELYRGRLSLEADAKLALGRTRQDVTINGGTLLSTVGVVTPFPGGLLAQTTNSGQSVRKEVDIVSELGATLGYQLGPRLKLTCAYTFIYWPHVVRPGDQIDMTVNGSYIPDPTVTPSGPLRPSFVFNETSYWAHGLKVGLDYRW